MRGWTVLTGLVAFLPLFLLYGRSSYPAPMIGAFGLLLSPVTTTQEGVRRWPVGSALVAVLIALDAFILQDARRDPLAQGWLGFGIGYQNPVEEARWLADGPGGDVYNLYNSGGYLLWRLAPRYKVMVDGRSFPYLAWLPALKAFSDGKKVTEFLARYPADIAVIDLLDPPVWRYFATAPGWHLVHHGPSAAIFAHGPAYARLRLRPAATPHRALAAVRNGQTAVADFDFAIFIGDFADARRALIAIEGPLHGQIRPKTRSDRMAYWHAYQALAAGDASRAKTLLESITTLPAWSPRDKAINYLLTGRAAAQGESNASLRATIDAGLAKLVPEAFRSTAGGVHD